MGGLHEALANMSLFSSVSRGLGPGVHGATLKSLHGCQI